MAAVWSKMPHAPPSYLGLDNISLASLNLDSSYTFDSAGDAIAIRFVAPTTTSLTKVGFFQHAAETGTPGNTLRFDLCTFTGSQSVPGGIVTNGSLTSIAPPGANKWIVGTYSTKPTITKGEAYFIVLGDASGGASDHIPVRSRGGISPLLEPQINPLVTSTNGFQTGLVGSLALPFYLEMTDGTIICQPYTQGNINWPLSSLKRGWKIVNGFTSDVLLTGVVCAVGGNTIDKLQIFLGSESDPGGTATVLDYQTTDDEDDLSGIAVIRGFGGVTLTKATSYRIVVTHSASSFAPDYLEIEDVAGISGLANCGLLGGDIHATIDSGSSTWTDHTDRYPMGGFIIDDFDESATAASSVIVNRRRIVR